MIYEYVRNEDYGKMIEINICSRMFLGLFSVTISDFREMDKEVLDYKLIF